MALLTGEDTDQLQDLEGEGGEVWLDEQDYKLVTKGSLQSRKKFKPAEFQLWQGPFKK